MCSRYERTQVRTASLAVDSLKRVVPAGDHEARRETLEVPLPRGGQGFIQVVDGEDDAPLRGTQAAEVAQVGVSAALHAYARRGSAREVHRHVERRSPVKSEGRQGHAPVAKGKQLGDAPLVGFQDQPHRLRPTGGRFPDGVRFSRASVPQLLARRETLGPRTTMGKQAVAFGFGLPRRRARLYRFPCHAHFRIRSWAHPSSVIAVR